MVTVHAEADNVEIFSPALLTMFSSNSGQCSRMCFDFCCFAGEARVITQIN